jgi:putative acetyltransferase
MGGLHGFANPRLAHVYELGMVIGAASQGQGVGGVVLRGLLELADRWLGARRVGLAVYADNARAVRLYERHGFVHEGRLRCDRLRDGDYVDSLVMGRVRP